MSQGGQQEAEPWHGWEWGLARGRSWRNTELPRLEAPLEVISSKPLLQQEQREEAAPGHGQLGFSISKGRVYTTPLNDLFPC